MTAAQVNRRCSKVAKRRLPSIPIVTCFFLVLALSFSAGAFAAQISIGVLANQGKEACYTRWASTFDSLQLWLPLLNIRPVCLDFQELQKAVEKQEVGFTITNPAMYVDLEYKYGASRIATLSSIQGGHLLSQFGTVIFRRSDRGDLATLHDLKGTRFAAVSDNSFGGWLIGRKHLLDKGIDAVNDFSEIVFTQAHRAVVSVVKNGVVDAGCIRTDILEQLAADGEISLDDFYVFPGADEPDENDFPFLRTSILYPEWAFARMKNSDPQLAKEIAVVLLGMVPVPGAEPVNRFFGWTLPLDYNRVHECLKALKVSPYDEVGQIPLLEVYRQYKFWIHLSGVFLLLAVSLFGLMVINDIRRMRALRRLSKEYLLRQRLVDELSEFKHTLDHVDDSVFLIDSKTYKFLYVNQGAVDRLGYSEEELLQMRPFEIKENYDHDEFLALLTKLKRESGSTATYRSDHRTKGGQIVPTEISLTHVEIGRDKSHYIAIVRDISKRLSQENETKLLQTRLLSEQKLASVGQLAAGIAHEINTPVQYVANNVDFIGESALDIKIMLERLIDLCQRMTKEKQASTDPDTLKAILEEADWEYLREEIPNAISQTRDGIEKISSIVKAMKAFSHPGSRDMGPTDINAILTNTIIVARNEWKYVAEMQSDLDVGLPLVEALSDEIGQVFLNIIVNAAQAIGDVVEKEKAVKKGLISVATGRENGWVWVRIGDTGSGIPQQIRDRICEPFFTTKDVGKGTGQGLAIVYDVVVNKHGGQLEFFDAEKGGTVFLVRLPIRQDVSQLLTDKVDGHPTV